MVIILPLIFWSFIAFDKQIEENPLAVPVSNIVKFLFSFVIFSSIYLETKEYKILP